MHGAIVLGSLGRPIGRLAQKLSSTVRRGCSAGSTDSTEGAATAPAAVFATSAVSAAAAVSAATCDGATSSTPG
eukprot:scaffold126821_cov36-Phaeocystis_antarctica.AAC.1